jgi:hypothetical protein
MCSNDQAKTRLVVDEFFLKALVRAGLQSKLLRPDDLCPELRQASRGYTQLSQKVLDLMLLYDEIAFTGDFADMRGTRKLDDHPMFLEYVIPYRIWESTKAREPRKIRLSIDDSGQKQLSHFHSVASEVKDTMGIEVFNPGELGGWQSAEAYEQAIADSMARDPDERPLPEAVLDTWPLVGVYLRRKFKFLKTWSDAQFAMFLYVYLTEPRTQVYQHFGQFYPDLKGEEDSTDLLCQGMSFVFYADGIIGNLLRASESMECTAALALRSPGGNPLTDDDADADQGVSLIRLTVNSFRDSGLYLPDTSDLRTVLQLRMSPEVKQFRQMLWHWVDLLKEGDVSHEHLVRKEVRRANDLMRRKVKCRKVGDLLLYMSLPSLVLDGLLGIPAIGTAISLAGLGFKLKERDIAEQIKWTLLLSQS